MSKLVDRLHINRNKDSVSEKQTHPVQSVNKSDQKTSCQPVLQKKHKDNTLSCRYELKYRILETKARAIARYIQSYISPDPYARKTPNQEYPISSLYFDSNNLHLCRETLEGKKNRFKLRIRCYDDDPQSVCFFEIKRRIDNVIIKDRARVPRNCIKDAIQGNPLQTSLYKKDRNALDQFNFYIHTLCANPVSMVRYMRQAFEDDSSNRVRITLDRELAFKTPTGVSVSTNGSGWHPVSMDFVILEIKFTNRYPAWLSDMVKIFDLKQTAMSKYCASVRQSHQMGILTFSDMVNIENG